MNDKIWRSNAVVTKGADGTITRKIFEKRANQHTAIRRQCQHWCRNVQIHQKGEVFSDLDVVPDDSSVNDSSLPDASFPSGGEASWEDWNEDESDSGFPLQEKTSVSCIVL
jgi:hypothetical protein